MSKQSDVKPVDGWVGFVDVADAYEGPYEFRSAYMAEGRHYVYSQETVTALQAEIVALRKDAERFAWVLPIIDGECDKFADARTAALAGQFLNGKSGRDAIDAAIAKEKQQ